MLGQRFDLKTQSIFISKQNVQCHSDNLLPNLAAHSILPKKSTKFQHRQNLSLLNLTLDEKKDVIKKSNIEPIFKRNMANLDKTMHQPSL